VDRTHPCAALEAMALAPAPCTAPDAVSACTYSHLRDGLFSNISHELLTPITTLYGYLALLAQEELGPLAPEQAEAVSIALRNVEMLRGMIGDLLDFASLSRDSLALAQAPAAVDEIVATALCRVERLAASRDITLDRRVTAPGAVFGDAARLTRVIEHLLENAIKFSPPGSRVQLRAARRRNCACIIIRDRAQGMNPDEVDRLLLPFMQGDTGLTRRYNGLGLGLSFAEKLIALHGGTLAIRTRPGHGTQVTVSLPAL
jgi:signal transduction histidine kinase